MYYKEKPVRPQTVVGSRRTFIIKAGKFAALAWGSNFIPVELASTPLLTKAAPDQATSKFIVHSMRPEDFETRVELLHSWITPNDLFFVRSHLYTPTIDAKKWRLNVSGEVQASLTLSINQLREFEQVKLAATLECAGNGRSFYEPRVPGVQWGHGAVGNCIWTGVRLRDVLNKAGLKPKGKHVLFDGADTPMTKTMPDFVRSLPLEKAVDSRTLLAYEMNGETLSPSHGYPLRLVVPGWAGDHWVKWITHVSVQENEYDGHFMKNAYRVPRIPIEPGADVDPKEMVVVTELDVKSVIARPRENTKATLGLVKISGAAWAGEANIVRVDVSTDFGRTWHPAPLGHEQAPYSWRLWEYGWKVDKPGSYLVMSRAADNRGRVQPISPSWNPSGYLWNAVDQVRIDVRAS